MGTFGSSGIGALVLIASGVVAIEVGWPAVFGGLLFCIGWEYLLVEVGRRFNPDGTRKPKPKPRNTDQHGRPH